MTLQQQHPPLCRQCWQVSYFNKLAKQSSAQISGRKHSPAHTAVPFYCSSAMMCCKAPTQQRCRQGSCCLSLPLPCLCAAPCTPALLRLQHHLDSSITSTAALLWLQLLLTCWSTRWSPQTGLPRGAERVVLLARGLLGNLLLPSCNFLR